MLSDFLEGFFVLLKNCEFLAFWLAKKSLSIVFDPALHFLLNNIQEILIVLGRVLSFKKSRKSFNGNCFLVVVIKTLKCSIQVLKIAVTSVIILHCVDLFIASLCMHFKGKKKYTFDSKAIPEIGELTNIGASFVIHSPHRHSA